MKLLLTFCLLIFWSLVGYSQKYDVKAIAEIDLGHSLGQLRAVPVSLGSNRPKAIGNAQDSKEAKARYAHPFHKISQRQKGNGYNLLLWMVFNLNHTFILQPRY